MVVTSFKRCDWRILIYFAGFLVTLKFGREQKIERPFTGTSIKKKQDAKVCQLYRLRYTGMGIATRNDNGKNVKRAFL